MNGDGDGDGAGASTGTGVEANEGVQDGHEDGSGDGAGTGTGREWRPVREHTMGTRTGPGRPEERRRSARGHTRVVDTMWETVKIRMEREENVDKKGLVQ